MHDGAGGIQSEVLQLRTRSPPSANRGDYQIRNRLLGLTHAPAVKLRGP